LFNERAPGQHDVELFREFYEKHGKGCFSLLDGSYTCAIVDAGEVILARDSVGARPLFYGSNTAFVLQQRDEGTDRPHSL